MSTIPCPACEQTISLADEMDQVMICPLCGAEFIMMPVLYPGEEQADQPDGPQASSALGAPSWSPAAPAPSQPGPASAGSPEGGAPVTVSGIALAQGGWGTWQPAGEDECFAEMSGYATLLGQPPPLQGNLNDSSDLLAQHAAPPLDGDLPIEECFSGGLATAGDLEATATKPLTSEGWIGWPAEREMRPDRSHGASGTLPGAAISPAAETSPADEGPPSTAAAPGELGEASTSGLDAGLGSESSPRSSDIAGQEPDARPTEAPSSEAPSLEAPSLEAPAHEPSPGECWPSATEAAEDTTEGAAATGTMTDEPSPAFAPPTGFSEGAGSSPSELQPAATAESTWIDRPPPERPMESPAAEASQSDRAVGGSDAPAGESSWHDFPAPDAPWQPAPSDAAASQPDVLRDDSPRDDSSRDDAWYGGDLDAAGVYVHDVVPIYSEVVLAPLTAPATHAAPMPDAVSHLTPGAPQYLPATGGTAPLSTTPVISAPAESSSPWAHAAAQATTGSTADFLSDGSITASTPRRSVAGSAAARAKPQGPGVIAHFIGIVGGGLFGLALGYYLLNLFGGERFNFLEIPLPGVPHTQRSSAAPPAPVPTESNRAQLADALQVDPLLARFASPFG